MRLCEKVLDWAGVLLLKGAKQYGRDGRMRVLSLLAASVISRG